MGMFSLFDISSTVFGLGWEMCIIPLLKVNTPNINHLHRPSQEENGRSAMNCTRSGLLGVQQFSPLFMDITRHLILTYTMPLHNGNPEQNFYYNIQIIK